MADSTDDQRRWKWQDGTSLAGHMQAVVDTARMRVDEAWRAYIDHTTRRCETTCRIRGVDCPEAVELKAAWNRAKDET